MRKLTYFISTTLDGCIAGPGGEYDFMYPVLDEDFTAALVASHPDALPGHVRPHLGLGDENRDFDTVIMGRGTYEPGLKAGFTSPYPHMKQYVVSESLAESPDPAVTVFSGDPLELVRELKAQEGKGIYLCGGGNLAGQLREEIDELVVKIYPFVAGDGIRLFSGEFAPERYELKDSHTFKNGAIVARYAKVTTV
ncbi:deaminase [Streptomyces cinnamoneus]|uniref:Deaminase n=1 Tax=Streptomyces cinnamoneus TaxID=53446 RepID=A0A2G1XFD3_STRCJ|nr:dihydrofolate reductase family protein [Streptomyces cinnamoneus]PHQ49943.1 deaminase [Streptomyces cinnamoneus]PPT13280.1 dihydrofolate reductase [Streptomyces cinnamoneus]